LREPFGRAPATPGRERIDHHTAADGARRRRIAQYQLIARERTDRPIERQAREHRAPRLDPFGVQRGDACRHMRCTEMQMHGSIGAQRA
jgi:hypothetical protein